MAQIALGNSFAFEKLVRRHLSHACAVARCILPSKADAEDAAQEAFTRLWVHAPKWQPGKSAFTTWLHAVVVNCARDQWRRMGRPSENVSEELADTSPGAEDALVHAQQRRAVAAALARLPEKQRIAVTLCYFEGMTNIKAAEAMGIHIKSLEGLLSRAREKLKPVLRNVRS